MRMELEIVWVHRPGETKSTVQVLGDGRDAVSLLRDLRPAVEDSRIAFRIAERESVDEKPGIFLNGTPIGDLLAEAAQSQFACDGRRCEPGPDIYFVKGTGGGQETLAVPEILIRKAVLLALEKD